MIASFSMGEYQDLCSAQVSNEQPLCCQSLAQTSYLGRALIKGLAGRCMLQALLRAEKLSRVGLVKLALPASISYFILNFVTAFGFFHFSLCREDLFNLWIFHAMLTLCNGTAGYPTFQFCACAHTRRKAEKEVNAWSLPQTESTIRTWSWSIVSLWLQKHPSELHCFPPLLSST